jgi:hypothetical protein
MASIRLRRPPCNSLACRSAHVFLPNIATICVTMRFTSSKHGCTLYGEVVHVVRGGCANVSTIV